MMDLRDWTLMMIVLPSVSPPWAKPGENKRGSPNRLLKAEDENEDDDEALFS